MKKLYNKGFTLIELMVAVLISVFIMMAIYMTFASQEKSQITQKQITEMQQNIRAAMHIMASEIRLAGHDQSLGRTAGARLIEAGPGYIQFSMDICLTDGTVYVYDDNGTPGDTSDDSKVDPDGSTDGPNENVIYAFDPADDADEDGMIDSPSANFEKLVLRRKTCPTDLTCSGLLPFAEFIQGIRFTYFDGAGNLIDNGGSRLSATQRSNVRTIRIAILGRTKRDIREMPDTNTYDMAGVREADGKCYDLQTPTSPPDVIDCGTVGPFNDTFRRRLLITTIKCRNLGIQ